MIVYSTVTVGSDPPGTVRIDFQPKDDGTTVATEWHRVQAGANPRSYRLSRKHTTRNNFISLEFDSSYTVSYKWEGGVRTNNNDQDYPLPINVTNQDADDIDRSRDVRLLAVAGGIVYRIEPASEDVVEVKGQTGGPQFSVIRPRIFSAVSYPNIYFADGEANRYYDSATDELKTWQGTAGGGSSSIPVSGGTYCRLICEWGQELCCLAWKRSRRRGLCRQSTTQRTSITLRALRHRLSQVVLCLARPAQRVKHQTLSMPWSHGPVTSCCSEWTTQLLPSAVTRLVVVVLTR